jgi:hypothetical protein
MSDERFIQSKTFRGALIGLGIAAAAFLLFWGGMEIGERKTQFGCKWGENYYRNFGDGGPRPSDRGWFRPGANGPTMSGHGAFAHDAVIKRDRETITAADLKIGDDVMAFGTPDDQGRITANFVRVMTGWPAQATQDGAAPAPIPSK